MLTVCLVYSVKLYLFLRVIWIFFVLERITKKETEYPGNKVAVKQITLFFLQTKPSKMIGSCKYILDLVHPPRITEILKLKLFKKHTELPLLVLRI